MLRARLLHRLRRFGRPGARGERLAARWLRRRGYRILGRNVRLGHDEADLVALDPDGCTLVVVEVKTTGLDAVDPARRVDGVKRRKLLRLARGLSRGSDETRRVRVDTVGVTCAGGRVRIDHRPGSIDPWR